MASIGQEQEGEIPRQFPNVPPPNIGQGAAHAQALAESLKDEVRDIKADVRAIRDYRFTDLVYHISVFGGGFLLLAGMMIFGYLKLDDKLAANTNAITRIDAKLEELLKRIPPLPTPAPTTLPPIKR